MKPPVPRNATTAAVSARFSEIQLCARAKRVWAPAVGTRNAAGGGLGGGGRIDSGSHGDILSLRNNAAWSKPWSIEAVISAVYRFRSLGIVDIYA